MKRDFKSFKPGTIFNPLKNNVKKTSPILEEISIDYPARLNAMAIDPSKIASNNNLVYTPGEIVFPIKRYTRINVKISDKYDSLNISDNSNRKNLIFHAYKLMKDAIGFNDGLFIDVDNREEIKHAGLGSSGSLIAGVASAINEIYGNPIPKQDLVRYLAQNHGEEIDDDPTKIMPVQCIGGSAAAGIIGGGLLVICGESCVVKSMKIPSSYRIIIGLPKDFIAPDSKLALEKELENMEGFINTGIKYGPKIAYEILHRGLPAMENGSLKPIGDIIFDYRYNRGSIKNCSFLYPRIVEISKKIAFLKEKEIAAVLSISSVGPGFFAVTENPELVKKTFEKEGLKVIETNAENEGYHIIKKVFENKFWNDPDIVKAFRDKSPDPLVLSELKDIVSKTSLDKQRSLNALDLGCGGGRHSELLAQMGFDTYAVDISPKMVEATSMRLGNFYEPNELKIRVKQRSMLRLPFPDDFFDVIVSTGVLHQAKSLEEYTLTIKEISRVAKTNALFVGNIFSSGVMDPSYQITKNKNTVITKEGLYMTLLSKADFIRLMKEGGFNIKGNIIEQIKEIETGPRCVLRAAFLKNDISKR